MRWLSVAVCALVVSGCGLFGRAAPSASPARADIATPTLTSAPPATTSAPTPTPAATATTGGTLPVCEMGFQAGDTPLVPPRRSGQFLQVALLAVRPAPDGGNRWLVRFQSHQDAPASAVIPLDVTVTGPAGPLEVRGYEAGPPNAESATVTSPVSLPRCDPNGSGAFARGAVVVGARTSSVTSGTYTFTWREIALAEGRRATETWTVSLTCTVDAGPNPQRATVCR